jgi:hypothetical protein
VLRCRKYKVTATSTEFICLTTDQCKLLHKQVIPSLCRDLKSATCLWASHVIMTSHISIQSALLSCRKYKVTAKSTKSTFISQHASANPTTNKLLISYLETKENGAYSLAYGVHQTADRLHLVQQTTLKD